MRPKLELPYYVSVGAGLALSTSSFLLISGLFQSANLVGVLLGIVAAGLLCWLIASTVAELASMFPTAPGIRTYLKAAIGDRTSMGLVYAYLAMIVLIAGAESHVFALVVKSVLPGVPTLAVVFGVLCLVIAVNLRGLELPVRLQMGATYLLLASAFAAGAAGLAVHGNRLPALLGSPGYATAGLLSVPAVAGMAIFLYIGFEWVTPLGLNKDSYRRLIPISMPIAIACNVVVCFVMAAGMAATLGGEGVGSTPIPHLAHVRSLAGTPGGYVALALSFLAITTTFNAGLLGGSRFMYALAREGRLPAACARISERTGVPKGSILALGGAALVSALAVNLFDLELLFAVVSSAIICFVYGALVFSVPRLRKLQPSRPRPFRSAIPSWALAVLGPALPLLGLASLFSVAEIAMQAPLLAGAIALAAGVTAAGAGGRDPGSQDRKRRARERELTEAGS